MITKSKINRSELCVERMENRIRFGACGGLLGWLGHIVQDYVQHPPSLQ